MKKKILLSVSLIIILMTAAAMYLYNKPSSQTMSGRPDYVVNAGPFFQEFEQNEIAANKKYLNRTVLVTGTVTGVQAVDSVGINITLETQNPLFGVSCEFTDPGEANNIKAGDKVSIKGLCTGMLLDVVLVKCSVEK